MSKTGAKKHVHRYHKIRGFWHCSLPDCTHFMPGNVADNMVGKKTVCWNCRKEFYLDDHALEKDKPICPLCEDPNLNELNELLREKGI